MADFKYLEKQEKLIEKKMAELDAKTEHMAQESRVNKIREKYDALLKKKKSGKLNWDEDVLLGIYKDAIKTEEKDK